MMRIQRYILFWLMFLFDFCLLHHSFLCKSKLLPMLNCYRFWIFRLRFNLSLLRIVMMLLPKMLLLRLVVLIGLACYKLQRISSLSNLWLQFWLKIELLMAHFLINFHFKLGWLAQVVLSHLFVFPVSWYMIDSNRTFPIVIRPWLSPLVIAEIKAIFKGLYCSLTVSFNILRRLLERLDNERWYAISQFILIIGDVRACDRLSAGSKTLPTVVGVAHLLQIRILLLCLSLLRLYDLLFLVINLDCLKGLEHVNNVSFANILWDILMVTRKLRGLRHRKLILFMIIVLGKWLNWV